ncbi:hypothetical protein [Hyperthermus butylicus]|uniref:Uncharacterized protein n=1 Tax=Hyperthermus butylicus (strain DSM 5456 / JCM 9403 / PLM1-5) TaxID=415426 RepID=A2BLK7_HYPBU|nr:hypothetical protein [Hyperthermus butylicus]ABM80868.1 hypothetical protein Hbut_1024 [Hyperthermus butylicus DSM 5456]
MSSAIAYRGQGLLHAGWVVFASGMPPWLYLAEPWFLAKLNSGLACGLLGGCSCLEEALAGLRRVVARFLGRGCSVCGGDAEYVVGLWMLDNNTAVLEDVLPACATCFLLLRPYAFTAPIHVATDRPAYTPGFLDAVARGLAWGLATAERKPVRIVLLALEREGLPCLGELEELASLLVGGPYTYEQGELAVATRDEEGNGRAGAWILYLDQQTAGKVLRWLAERATSRAWRAPGGRLAGVRLQPSRVARLAVYADPNDEESIEEAYRALAEALGEPPRAAFYPTISGRLHRPLRRTP